MKKIYSLFTLLLFITPVLLFSGVSTEDIEDFGSISLEPFNIKKLTSLLYSVQEISAEFINAAVFNIDPKNDDSPKEKSCIQKKYKITLSGLEAKWMAKTYPEIEFETLQSILGNSHRNFREKGSESSSHLFIASPSVDNFELFKHFVTNLHIKRAREKNIQNPKKIQKSSFKGHS